MPRARFADLMGPAFYITLLLFCFPGAFNAAWAQKKYDPTSAGIQEDTKKFGGISEAEMQALDAQARKILEKFKNDRKENESNRFYNKMAFHDFSFIGIAEHGLNGLEKTMDEAANAGASRKITTVEEGQKRSDEIEEARKNAGNCKDGYIQGATDSTGGKVACRNISSNIVDRGAAHGDASDSHRIYDLSDEAYKRAEAAGKSYAQDVIAESANYDTKNAASREIGIADAGVGRDDNGNYGKIITVKGKRVAVGANIAYMQSEAAFLNQQATTIVETEWRYLRAQRLAGSNTAEGQHDEEIRKLISQAPKDNPDKIGESVAEYIAKRRALGESTIDCEANREICEAAIKSQCDGKPTQSERDSCKADLRGTSVSLKKITDPSAKKKAFEAVEKKGLDPELQKQMQKDIAAAKNCMKPGVWCGDDLKPTEEIDAGVAKDTREIIANTAALMVRATPEQALKILKGISADVSAANDAKAKNVKLYQGWIQQIENAKKRRDAINQEARANGLPPPIPRGASMADIFKSRDLARGDGDTLGKPGFGPGAAAAGPNPRGPGGPLLRQGSPAPVPASLGGAAPANTLRLAKPAGQAPARPNLQQTNNPLYRQAVRP